MRLLAICLAGLCLLAGCATPGAPQPPSLQLPRPVSDLQAVRQADTVTLTWTVPQLNTDRTRVRRLGPTRICRGLNALAMDTCVEVVAVTLPVPVASAGKFRAQLRDTLPRALLRQDPAGFVTYAVEVQNQRGRNAGLSNRVEVPLAPVGNAATEAHATTTAEGVRLDWKGSAPVTAPTFSTSYHVYRLAEEAPPGTARVDLGAAQAKDDAFALLDRSFEWEKPYLYSIVPVTNYELHGKSGQFDGDEVTLELLPHDIFPPAVPTGLQAAFSGREQQKFIDLSWNPGTEPDLAGYNVYRHLAGQPPVKINSELVKAPAYRDSKVQSGQTYFYSVAAVDVRGNESARSAETSEAVP
jgi:hypothetical protein